jgi:hypothetical protein
LLPERPLLAADGRHTNPRYVKRKSEVRVEFQ